MKKKIEIAPGEPIPDVGESYAGGVVVTSFPEVGSRDIIVDVPDDVPSVAAVMQDKITAERDEYEYGVLGFDVVTPFNSDLTPMLGNTYSLVGVDEEVRRRGNYGAGDVISIMGDTGYHREHQAYLDRNPYWWSPYSSEPRDKHGHGCISPTDLVYTSLCGLQTIKTVFDQAPGIVHILQDGAMIKDISRYAVKTIALDQNWHSTPAQITHIHRLKYNGPVYEISTGHGILTLTPWHPVYVETSRRGQNATVVKRRADALKLGDKIVVPEPGPSIGDYVTIPVGDRWRGDQTESVRLDEDLGYLLGLIASDGHLMNSSDSIEFVNNNVAIAATFVQLTEKIFGVQCKQYEDKRQPNTVRVRAHSIAMMRLVESCGIPRGAKSKILGVPNLVTKSPRSVICAFIAGYADGNGCVSESRLRLITGSELFAHEMVTLLRMIGVRASSHPITGGGFAKTISWQIRIGYDAELMSALKYRTLENPALSRNRHATTIREIRKYEYDGEMYDFTVPEYHNYVANGHIVSNTHVSALIFGRDPWGIATDAACAVFQVLNDESGTGSESDIANAFRAIGDYVVAQRVRAGVANFSLGGRHSSVMNAAIAYMLQRNVWPICAAGNEGSSASVGSPGDARGVMCVGAVERTLTLASFSSGGGTSQVLSCYDPGVNIASAMTGTVDGIKLMSGTSMATPHTSALFTLLAASGMSFDEAKAYVQAHMRDLNPRASNGRGFFAVALDFGTVAPAPEPVPEPGEPPTPLPVERLNALCDEQIATLDSSGTSYDIGLQHIKSLTGNYPEGTPDAVKSQINTALEFFDMARYGPHMDGKGGYVHAMDLAWEIKNSLPKAGEAPLPLPPTTPKIPDWVNPGTVTIARYGSDPRHLAKTRVAEDWKSGPIIFLWHGGGWLQGDYDVIPQATVQEVSNWFIDEFGGVLIEPTYRLGNVVHCMEDAGLAARVFVQQLREAGASGEVYYLGHSAGGHLAWSVALTPDWDSPIPSGVISLAGAGLAMHANTQIANQMTKKIFDIAWGSRVRWEGYSPVSHLEDRPDRIKGYVVQGSRDDQLDPQWAEEFQRAARAAGHNVHLDKQMNGDHFSVANPVQNRQTAMAIRKVIKGDM